MTSDHEYESNPAVNNFRNYLRIRSVHPNVNYDECVAFLRGQAAKLGLPVQVYEPVPGKPIVVITWEGLEPSLPSIMFGSHMDVVGVDEEQWIYPPFEARIVDGVIYARGAQDNKSNGIQHIEAVKRLKSKGIRLKRTILLTFFSEEELGGKEGMGAFVQTEDFRKLNVGLSMNEGKSSGTEDFMLFYGERTVWHMRVTCRGKSGHGSVLLPDNSGEKIRYIIDKFMDLRTAAKKKLAENPELGIDDITTVNLTMLSGGFKTNIVPDELSVDFDVRIATSTDIVEFENMINRWCQEAGDGVTILYIGKEQHVRDTVVDDSNPYMVALRAAANQLKISLKLSKGGAGSDNRFMRGLGIPAFGFSPLAGTPYLAHATNERQPVEIFLRGIEIYETIIPALANV